MALQGQDSRVSNVWLRSSLWEEAASEPPHLEACCSEEREREREREREGDRERWREGRERESGSADERRERARERKGERERTLWE